MAYCHGSLRHRLQIGAAVAGGRVHVEIPAKVLAGDERGQFIALSRLDLASVLAQLRRNRREPQRSIDPVFVRAGYGNVVVDPVDAVLVQLEPALQRAVSAARCCALWSL